MLGRAMHDRKWNGNIWLPWGVDFLPAAFACFCYNYQSCISCGTRQSFWSCLTQTVLVSAGVVPSRAQRWQVSVAVRGLGDTRKHKHQNKGNMVYIQYALNTHIPRYLKLLLLNSWHERIGCCMYAELCWESYAELTRCKSGKEKLHSLTKQNCWCKI